MSKTLDVDTASIIQAVASSTSAKQAARKLNAPGVAERGLYRAVRRHIKQLGLDTSHFSLTGRCPNNKLPIETMLIEHSTFSNTSRVKRRCIAEGLLVDICSECGQLPIWHGKPLVLQLDHINGRSDDHRLSNLRILCPNCHTQTPNFTSKSSKRPHSCSSCKRPLTRKRKSGLCSECYKVAG